MSRKEKNQKGHHVQQPSPANDKRKEELKRMFKNQKENQAQQPSLSKGTMELKCMLSWLVKASIAVIKKKIEGKVFIISFLTKTNMTTFTSSINELTKLINQAKVVQIQIILFVLRDPNAKKI